MHHNLLLCIIDTSHLSGALPFPSLPLSAIDKITYAYGQAKTYEELNLPVVAPFASFVCMCETWERCEERALIINPSYDIYN